MIMAALWAAGDGGCSTPVQIRAWLSCKEEEGSYVALPTWTSAFLCAMVGAGVNVQGNPFALQAVAGDHTPPGWKALGFSIYHLCGCS